MKLYERVRNISDVTGASLAAIARSLGMHERTFQNYLKESREDNLWPLLPKILEIFPNLNREWLYFGEGEMLTTANAHGENPAALRAELEQVKQELDEERRLNRQLTTRLLIDGVGDKGAQTSTGKAGDGQG